MLSFFISESLCWLCTPPVTAAPRRNWPGPSECMTWTATDPLTSTRWEGKKICQNCVSLDCVWPCLSGTKLSQALNLSFIWQSAVSQHSFIHSYHFYCLLSEWFPQCMRWWVMTTPMWTRRGSCLTRWTRTVTAWSGGTVWALSVNKSVHFYFGPK